MDETNIHLLKTYIIREVSFLSQDSKKVVRDIIIQSHSSMINEYPDGLRCDLNSLSSECVTQIYNYIKNVTNIK